MTFFYAVANGFKTGVYMSWDECKKQIDNFPNPIFKKFDNIEDATEFIDDHLNNLYVYTDGACINNGSPNATAGIGIYFNKDNPLNVSRKLEYDKKLTNNIAELVAGIEAIEIIKNNPIKNKFIVTDSEYIIKCATGYGKKLEANNWKTSNDKIPPNLDLVKRLYHLTNKYNIKYKHIEAHTNNKDKHSIGNYYADLLANKSINNQQKTEKFEKIYLNVSYKEKDEAKKKGAKWDAENKKWYIYSNNPNLNEFVERYK